MSGKDCYNSYGGDNSSLYLDLINTMKCLEELQAEEPTSQTRNFEAWYDHRKLTIETIEKLQEKINDLCVGANVVRGVGAVAGLASIFAGIVGCVLEAKGHESAETFKDIGKYGGGASIAVMASSTFLEAGLSQCFMNEVESVLKKDIELTKPLSKWVGFSRQVDLLLEEHFDCSIISNTFPKVMEVVGYCIEALDAGQTEIRHLLRDLGSCKIRDIEDLTVEVSQIVMNFLRRIYNNPKLLEPLRSIWKIFKETPYTFEFAKLGCYIYCTIYRALDSSRLSCLLSLAGIASPGFGATFVRFAFDAVTIGANVVTLILAAKNIKEGKSKYSDILDDILKALRREMEEARKRMDTLGPQFSLE